MTGLDDGVKERWRERSVGGARLGGVVDSGGNNVGGADPGGWVSGWDGVRGWGMYRMYG